jgi:hypothetical protein
VVFSSIRADNLERRLLRHRLEICTDSARNSKSQIFQEQDLCNYILHLSYFVFLTSLS